MATFVQLVQVTYESIMEKAAANEKFAVLCSTNWCRYCPSAVKLFEKLQKEREDIELIILKDMGDTIFKELSVSSYPTMIAFENGEEIYRGSDKVAFCRALGVEYQRKIRRRPDGSDYRVDKNGEETNLSKTAAEKLRDFYGESLPPPEKKIRTDSQGKQFMLTCEGDVCRKIYLKN